VKITLATPLVLRIRTRNRRRCRKRYVAIAAVTMVACRSVLGPVPEWTTVETPGRMIGDVTTIVVTAARNNQAAEVVVVIGVESDLAPF
jgi:hypothetical protein